MSFRTLDQLYRALEQDESSHFAHFSPTLVRGEGARHAEIMLMGEQPGDVEDQQQRPFVGPAGKVLNACLDELGADRSSLFLTNAVKRFKYVQRGKRRLHQPPTLGEIKHYRWWLCEEVRLVDPKVIVALGGTALVALTGKRTIKPVRGKVLAWDGRELVPTVHPSYLLRVRDEADRHEERERFTRDLAVAIKAAAQAR